MSKYGDYKSKNNDPSSSQGSAKKPEKYASEYTSISKELFNDYLSREDFNYNVNTDKLYGQYAEKYKREGENAMRDTMANASGLSGGYGNSYAVTAGSQAYRNYLEKLNDIIPSLEERAFERYTEDSKQAKERYEAAAELEEQDYKRYRDEMEDYFADRKFFEDNYRYREDADREFYLALYEYLLESEALDLEGQKIANDYKAELIKAYN